MASGSNGVVSAIELHNTYLIVRHGQSEANVEGIVVSKPENGCGNYGLTSTGREQVTATAKEIAQWLESKGKST